MPRIVWMAHLDEEQELLWETALASQQINVSIRSPYTDITQDLEAVYGNERHSPEILLLDVAVKCPNSEMLQFGSIAQWAAEKFNPPKIVLLNPRQDYIRSLERNWALRRGAVDLLPRMTQANYERLVTHMLAMLGRPCVPDLLHSAMRSHWTGGKQVELPTLIQEVPESAVFVQSPAVVNLKNPQNTEKTAKYVTYRGVRVRR